MSYLKALTKDSIGDRKFKLKTDLDDVKFDENMKIKKQKKVESEQLAIANAVTASKEVRRRAIDKKNGVEQKDDDDIVEVRKEIDNAMHYQPHPGQQVNQVLENQTSSLASDCAMYD